MAARRPAKIASQKKAKGPAKICPITGKSMTPVKLFRHEGSSGMYWVVIEDFDGSNQAIDRMIPVR